MTFREATRNCMENCNKIKTISLPRAFDPWISNPCARGKSRAGRD
jgi:hypothetical protein